MKRQLTEEQKAKRDERHTKFRQLAAKIANMPEADRVELSRRIQVTTIEGRSLSLANQMLLALQMPVATIVGGFRQWIKAGRCVRKGEHGAMIWCPTGNKVTDASNHHLPTTEAATTDNPDLHFIIGTVFDVSQTDVLEATKVNEVAGELVAA